MFHRVMIIMMAVIDRLSHSYTNILTDKIDKCTLGEEESLSSKRIAPVRAR